MDEIVKQAYSTLRVDSEFARKIGAIAEANGISVANYLQNTFGDVVEADYVQASLMLQEFEKIRQKLGKSTPSKRGRPTKATKQKTDESEE